MRAVFIMLIKCYRYCLSPFMAGHCRFYPTCSCYAEQALREHRLSRASWLIIKRIGRCHPWHPGGLDDVPHNDTKPNNTKII